MGFKVLMSILYKGEWSASRLGRFIPGNGSWYSLN